MAKRVKPKAFRRDRARELETLAQILSRHAVCSDTYRTQYMTLPINVAGPLAVNGVII